MCMTKLELFKSMALELQKVPETLYNYSLAAVVANYSIYENEIRAFPGNMLFDLYYQLYKASHFSVLGLGLSKLDTFKMLLKVKDKRCLLHNCFQAVMDCGFDIASNLAEAFKIHCSSAYTQSSCVKNKVIQLGFSLGIFLHDAGWFFESETVFLECLSFCHTCDQANILQLILQCHIRLLFIRSFYCKFEEGKETFYKANEYIKEIKQLQLKVDFSSAYGEFSSFYFSQNNYKESYRWAVKALNELNANSYPRETVRVLCQAAKACILKREFKRSEMLMKQALHLAKKKCGSQSLVFASTLVDYGYYLLNVDSMGHAIKAYQAALSLYTRIFGGNNLLVAKCHEELAYTSYAYGYSSGSFKDAMEHADKALSIMQNLLSEDNFLFASVKRIKALILEEIAIDSHDVRVQSKLFAEAQELHMYALQYALQTFGELNIHTAKYYGNLGRLFQSMRKYKESQDMHLKSIAIKEAILGPNDYEVALSVGHLASLYTYDMDLHKEAEVLFLRYMEIGITLFGESYSGLEYSYRGLLRVYTKLGLSDKVLQYRSILHNWKELRDQIAEKEEEFSPLDINLEPIAPENMMSYFDSIQ